MNIYERADALLLPGFTREFVEVDGNQALAVTKGSGPPLLMLHGDPQTHLCWHLIAPALSEHFAVVLTDIRGRGETHRPDHHPDHNAYSKRLMGNEQVALMQMLGHHRFDLIAHDRGARVARRMALDHPDKIRRLVVMDIVPALDFYEHLNAGIAQDYFYFTFLTQAHPIPDTLIAGDAEAFMRLILFGLSASSLAYEEAALEAYIKSSTSNSGITAMCECFRAGYNIDQYHDKQDRSAGNKITCPTLVMWGTDGVVGKHFDMRSIWHGWCSDPQFAEMPCGHFIPEEAPAKALEKISAFLGPNTEAITVKPTGT